MDMFGWGFGPFEAALREHVANGRIGGRVVREGGSRCGLMTAWGELEAVVAGRLRQPLVVGDVVALDPIASRVEALMPRRAVIQRRRVGGGSQPQLLAANVDVGFCITAAGADFSAERVERFIALAMAGGVAPVIVLSKCDVAAGHEHEALKAVAAGHPVVLTSALASQGEHADQGVSALREHLGKGRTGVLLGSSGVGKSTLVNALCRGVLRGGEQLRETAAVRPGDDKGRHTTTSRALIQLPNDAGMLIDTPGLREVGLVGGDSHVDATFPEVTELMSQCSFRDCSHSNEAGCAVQRALAVGQLDGGRWRRFQALRDEADHESLRQNEHDKRRHGKALSRHYRDTQRAGRHRKKG